MSNRVTDAAGRASDYAGERIEGNPLAALAAGLAVGAVVGALLPRTESERALLGTVGTKLNDTARSALTAAKDAGRSALDEQGISREAARAQVDKLVEAATKTAGAATGAATQAVRGTSGKDGTTSDV